MDSYSNPVARDGDFADPFVLRFDGRYYLYCTNRDVRCWSSTDLVHWRLEGPTVAEGTFGDLVPFAPEVVYADGVFWMYTSPSGTGHRVLRSDSPTGPFVPASGNIGRDIDGNVLVDDDGRWFFFWASDRGVLGCEMDSPVDLGDPVPTGAFMHGWTEGPFVEKRGGAYHMTLTGNHYLSPGYRIDAAVSRRPLDGYVGDPLNPVLVSATPPLVGLGHSSSVLGPDLVSHYIAYHNLNPDRSRDLNIDRQVWNGESLQVLGPTTTAPVPPGPDRCTRWGEPADDGRWVVERGRLVTAPGRAVLSGGSASVTWDVVVGRQFTSEHNLALVGPATGPYGVMLRARDGDVTVRVEVDAATGAIDLALESGSAGRVAASAPLPAGFAHDALHCIRLVLDAGLLSVLVDGRRTLEAAVPIDEPSHLGYYVADGSLRIGYTAVTRSVEPLASRAAPKPVPGRWWAALTATAGVRERVDEPISYDRLVLCDGSEAEYEVLVAATGDHRVYLSGRFDPGTSVGLSVDGGPWADGDVVASHGVAALPVVLTAGAHVLRLRATAGRAAIDTVTVGLGADEPTFSLGTPVALAGTGKLAVGDDRTHDCTVEAVISVDPRSPGCHGDVLVRASHLADGGEGDDPELGFDFLLGYSVQLHADRVVVARHAYDERVLAEVLGDRDLAEPHHVVVEVRGGVLTVTVDGAAPVTVRDPFPHVVGGAGVRVRGGDLRVEKLSTSF